MKVKVVSAAEVGTLVVGWGALSTDQSLAKGLSMSFGEMALDLSMELLEIYQAQDLYLMFLLIIVFLGIAIHYIGEL